MIILLSVQHTGTRFTATFLESMGVIYRQYHSELQYVDELRHENAKVVIPVRDPLLAFTSLYQRASDKRFTLKQVIESYDLLMLITGAETNKPWFEHIIYLRLDATDRDATLKDVADFCDFKDQITFKWEPVGNMAPTPTDHTMWEFITREWPDAEKQKVLDALAPARAHYGF